MLSTKILFIIMVLTISVKMKAQDVYKVTVQRLNIRATPSVNGRLMGSLHLGDKVTVEKIQNGWATISYNGKTCYINEKYIVIEKRKIEQKKEVVENKHKSTNIQQRVENKDRQSVPKTVSSKITDGHSGLDFSITTGYDFGLKDNEKGSLPVEVEFGKRFNKNIYWGGGAGISIPMGGELSVAVPITTNIKVFFPSSNSSIVPLLMFRAGYQMNTKDIDYSSVLLQLMPGLQFPLTTKMDFNLMAGYTRTVMTKGGEGGNSLGIKLGLSFHQDQAKPKRILPPSEGKRFQIGVETGGMFSSDMSGVSLSLLGTYKLDQLLSFGLGMNYGGYANDDEFTQFCLFARGQYRKNDNLWSPFVACDLGFFSNSYTTGMRDDASKTGLFLTPTVGLSLRSSINSYVDFRLGYEIAPSVGETQYEESMRMSGITLRVNFTRTLNF